MVAGQEELELVAESQDLRPGQFGAEEAGPKIRSNAGF